MSVKDYPAQPGRLGYVVRSRYQPDSYLLIRDCPFCGKEARVVVPAQGLWDWEHGAFVQNAFPEMSESNREIVMTGTHAECWEEAFAEPQEGCPDGCGDTVIVDETGVVCASCGWRE